MPSRRFCLSGLALVAVLFVAQTQQAWGHLTAEPIPAPAAVNGPVKPADCCPTPCIIYRHVGPKLCCDCTKPAVETTLKVKPPCSECEIDVVVCVPGCCTGEPEVCHTTGFLGRPVVEYQWCCGYSVRVAFRHCGDVLVTTWGR
jgi:hypothetical protein